MKDVSKDTQEQPYDPETPPAKQEQNKDYQKAPTAPSLKKTRLPDAAGDTDEKLQDEADPVRALLNAMRRAANYYITAPIAARFSDSNRKQ